MLRLRFNVDLKCPMHPNRAYPAPRAECALCGDLSELATALRETERRVNTAGRCGAVVRWRQQLRRRGFSGASASGLPQ